MKLRRVVPIVSANFDCASSRLAELAERWLLQDCLGDGVGPGPRPRLWRQLLAQFREFSTALVHPSSVGPSPGGLSAL